MPETVKKSKEELLDEVIEYIEFHGTFERQGLKSVPLNWINRRFISHTRKHYNMTARDFVKEMQKTFKIVLIPDGKGGTRVALMPPDSESQDDPSNF